MPANSMSSQALTKKTGPADTSRRNFRMLISFGAMNLGRRVGLHACGHPCSLLGLQASDFPDSRFLLREALDREDAVIVTFDSVDVVGEAGEPGIEFLQGEQVAEHRSLDRPGTLAGHEDRDSRRIGN